LGLSKKGADYYLAKLVKGIGAQEKKLREILQGEKNSI